jgi:hypothetical protein
VCAQLTHSARHRSRDSSEHHRVRSLYSWRMSNTRCGCKGGSKVNRITVYSGNDRSALSESFLQRKYARIPTNKPLLTAFDPFGGSKEIQIESFAGPNPNLASAARVTSKWKHRNITENDVSTCLHSIFRFFKLTADSRSRGASAHWKVLRREASVRLNKAFYSSENRENCGEQDAPICAIEKVSSGVSYSRKDWVSQCLFVVHKSITPTGRGVCLP